MTTQKVKVRRETVDQTIHRLDTYIRRFERRYERPSDQMALEVKRGEIKETAEISRWLSSYMARKQLARHARSGRMTDTPTT